MQQQAALMAASQGSYLNPMAAIAAAQMQQMAAFNVNGLVAAPMTPSSGVITPPHTLEHTDLSVTSQKLADTWMKGQWNSLSLSVFLLSVSLLW